MPADHTNFEVQGLDFQFVFLQSQTYFSSSGKSFSLEKSFFKHQLFGLVSQRMKRLFQLENSNFFEVNPMVRTPSLQSLKIALLNFDLLFQNPWHFWTLHLGIPSWNSFSDLPASSWFLLVPLDPVGSLKSLPFHKLLEHSNTLQISWLWRILNAWLNIRYHWVLGASPAGITR